MGKETFRAEYVRCGKTGCRRCPHGPYWYGYKREGEKVRKRYYGKADPREVGQHLAAKARDKADPREAIFQWHLASRELALDILGLSQAATWPEISKKYKELCQKLHPDRGGSTLEMQYVIAAHTYLRAMMK